jgi:hypothetical protein
MRAYSICSLGISSDIDPLSRFMHQAKPAVKKNSTHIVATTTKILHLYFDIRYKNSWSSVHFFARGDRVNANTELSSQSPIPSESGAHPLGKRGSSPRKAGLIPSESGAHPLGKRGSSPRKAGLVPSESGARPLGKRGSSVGLVSFVMCIFNYIRDLIYALIG